MACRGQFVIRRLRAAKLIVDKIDSEVEARDVRPLENALPLVRRSENGLVFDSWPSTLPGF